MDRRAGSDTVSCFKLLLGSLRLVADWWWSAGVRIGDSAVVGAGSVVTRNVPPRTVVSGNPARVVKEIEEQDNLSDASRRPANTLAEALMSNS